MNTIKSKRIRRMAKLALSHVPNGYDQLKELYGKLDHRQRGKASRDMARASDKTEAAVFCVRLLKTVVDGAPRSRRIPLKPCYIRALTGKKYKGKGVTK